MGEDGSVEHSHGDLQNNEQAANLLYKMVLCAAKVSVHPTNQVPFKRFTGERNELDRSVDFHRCFSLQYPMINMSIVLPVPIIGFMWLNVVKNPQSLD